ncbi:MAG: T9SS type A sorting domain-containing protein [Crocinitomix sp.]|nr:T9SS type A sorting domain-containing protein [Crocinitomix sp.]
MRALVLILLSSVFIQNSQAQEPDYFNNAPQWSTDNEFIGAGPFPPYQEKNIYYLDGYETIGAYTYHILYEKKFRHEGWGTGVFSAIAPVARLKIRQEGRNIYFYHTSFATDSLLISYEHEVGETMGGLIGDSHPVTITEIDSILIGDAYRRVFYFDEEDSIARFIEGIGCFWDVPESLYENFGTPFHQGSGIEYEPSLQWYIYQFNCYSEFGISLWRPLPYLNCNLTLNSTENKLINDFPVVYPNPATSNLTIENNGNEIDKLEIYTILGQIIGSYTIAPNSNQTIDINGFSQGIYILQFSEKGSLKAQEKLTIQ